MNKNIWIMILIVFTLSCKNKRSTEILPVRTEYPEVVNLKTLPEQIRVVGTVLEFSPGYCGTICQGGYIRVTIDDNADSINFKSVFVITACLPLGVKDGIRIDVNATIYKGTETECYYQSFDRPQNSERIVFYKLTEAETAKIH